MPLWIALTLIGTSVYTLTIFNDKLILSKYIKDYRGMVIYSAIVGFVSGTIIWILTGFPLLGVKDGAFVILSGIFSIVSLAIYYKVIQEEDATKVVFLFQLTPVFVLILSYLFLRESISLKQFVGFFIILLASLLINNKGSLKLLFKVDKSLILITISNILFAFASVIFKFVVEAGSFIKVAAYESWGWALGGLLLYLIFPAVRYSFKYTLKDLSKVTISLIFGNEAIYLISKLFTFWGVSLGPVFLVSILSSTSTFFGILFGVILTLLIPSVYKEDLSLKALLFKTLCAVLMLLGISLLY